MSAACQFGSRAHSVPTRLMRTHVRCLSQIGTNSGAEVFLQDQRHGSAQAGHAVFMGGDHARRAGARQRLVLHLGFNDGAEAMPGAGAIAHHHDALGMRASASERKISNLVPPLLRFGGGPDQQ